MANDQIIELFRVPTHQIPHANAEIAIESIEYLECWRLRSVVFSASNYKHLEHTNQVQTQYKNNIVILLQLQKDLIKIIFDIYTFTHFRNVLKRVPVVR